MPCPGKALMKTNEHRKSSFQSAESFAFSPFSLSLVEGSGMGLLAFRVCGGCGRRTGSPEIPEKAPGQTRSLAIAHSPELLDDALVRHAHSLTRAP